MSIGQWPYPEQVTFPAVDREQVTPNVADVALLAGTRTVDTSGTLVGTFNSDTNPTDVQVNGLIAQAVTMVLTPLPDYFQESLYGRVKQAITLQAAILIETSFYREQANAGSIVAMTAALAAMRAAIEADAGGAAVSQRVDTIVARSTIAEYDPYYVMPPPPVVGGGRAAALQPVPPTGPPQVASISPPSWSVSNRVNVIVSASGFNLQATSDLVAYLEDSANATVASTSIVDPSGTGTMLTCTFPPPTAAIKLGAGWFYLRKAGAAYAAEVPWSWVA
jgi:hypothetical protein